MGGPCRAEVCTVAARSGLLVLNGAQKWADKAVSRRKMSKINACGSEKMKKAGTRLFTYFGLS
jgi:hypothetical protein